MRQREYYLAFACAPNIGPRRLHYLLKLTKTLENAWNADIDIFKQAEMGGKVFQKFDEFRKEFDIEEYVEKLKHNKVEFITIVDLEYPELLKQIPDPPIVLFVKGNKKLLYYETKRVAGVEGFPTRAQRSEHWREGKRLTGPARKSEIKQESRQDPFTDKPTFAVVGTRKMTSYGREVTRKIAGELAKSGMIIVSGLALGVDAIAHKSALNNGGATIAVLGCGVDCCYPRENQRLYDEIIEKGSLIVSSYPLSMEPNKGTFPARNRIIAGLSLGVLVTEAAQDSGSLITADYAQQFNRPVFAVPDPITSTLSAGTTHLLKTNAKLVTIGQDILEALNIKPEVISEQTFVNLSADEKKIVKLLENESCSIDGIAQIGIPITQLMSILSNLELKGIVVNSNQEYSLKMN